jgi:hypothetical protein
MDKRSRQIAFSIIIFSGLVFSVTPSFAQQKTIKACEEEWRANKAANEAAKITEKDYVAKCRADSAKPAAATPAPAATKMSAPAAAKKPADPQEAEHARERACGADWKAAKAGGKVAAGMTWPKYWSECDKRKKAAGM